MVPDQNGPLYSLLQDFGGFQNCQAYFDKIFKLYGLLRTIVSDRDVRFMNYFLKTLWHLVGTKLKFFVAYHPKHMVRLRL